MEFRPDAYVPDMEDSVPNGEKLQARGAISAHLKKLSAVGPKIIPRVNSLETGLTEEDLATVVGPYVHGVSIGKIHSAEDIRYLSALITDIENKKNITSGQTRLILWIETAQAVVHCYAICRASPRIIGVAFGAEDFTHDMGIERIVDESESELAYARHALCIAARAANIPAFDTPYFKFKDEVGLTKNVLIGKKCGFKGKFAIHPAQVDIINRMYSPSEQDIDHARRVVAAFEKAEQAGRGSTSLQGKVIDVPVVKRARAVLELAESLSMSVKTKDTSTSGVLER